MTRDEDYSPEMPPVDAGYLLECLFEVGPAIAAGMGVGPVTQLELSAWQSNTGIVLTPWEVRTVRRLSLDYIGELEKSKKADRLPPWDAEKVRARLAAKSLQDSIMELNQL